MVSRLGMQYVTEVSPHFGSVSRVLGERSARNTVSKSDRIVEMMTDGGRALGFIIYKTALKTIGEVADALQLRGICTLAGEDQLQSLVHRVKAIASEKKAKHVAFYPMSDDVKPRNVSDLGFTREGVNGDRYYVMRIDIKGKRRRDEEDEVDDSRRGEQKRTRVEEPRSRAVAAKVHKLPMKGTIYFDFIIQGVKKFEGRVNGPACQRMSVGDTLRMFDRRAGWGIECKVSSKDEFRTFRDMLTAKGVVAMLPQLQDKARTLTPEQLMSEGTRIYFSFPGSQRVQANGCVAIGVEFVKKITQP